MKVLVTGATGFLGRPVVRSLIHNGHSVLALSRKKKESTNTQQLIWLQGDLAHASEYHKEVQAFAPEAVIHLAWQDIPDFSFETSRQNLNQSIDLLSFILDDAFTVKKFFDKWQEKIIDTETGNVNYWNNFVATINITRLSNDATSFADASDMYKIELREAYPSAVGEIALGHTQGGEILRLSVTFKYRKWMTLT